MPKGRVATEAEYEEFALRMISEAEDLDYAATAEEWEEFVRIKIGPTDSQLSALLDYRPRIAELREELQVSHETPFPTRPSDFRFRVIDSELWGQRAGTYVSRQKVNDYLQGYLPRGGSKGEREGKDVGEVKED